MSTCMFWANLPSDGLVKPHLLDFSPSKNKKDCCSGIKCECNSRAYFLHLEPYVFVVISGSFSPTTLCNYIYPPESHVFSALFCSPIRYFRLGKDMSALFGFRARMDTLCLLVGSMEVHASLLLYLRMVLIKIDESTVASSFSSLLGRQNTFLVWADSRSIASCGSHSTATITS